MTQPAERDTGSSLAKPSARAGLRAIRGELGKRRLRLGDLPPLQRRIGRAALGLTLVAAAMLAAYPLLETGTGLPWTDSSGQPSGLSPIGVAVMFGGAAVAFALAAFAAPYRHRRLVAGGLAVAGFVILPTDVMGGLGGGYAWPLASWAMFIGLSAVVVLAAAAILGVPRSRFTLAALAALPPLSALGIVVVLQGVTIPADVVGDPQVVPRLALSEAVQGAGALAGMFAILAIWAVIEFSKGLGAASSGAFRLRPRWWWIVPALAALKLAWLAAVTAGWTPAPITPNTRPSDVIGGESPLSLVLATVFVGTVGLAAARRWLPAGRTGLTTGVFWLIVIPIIAAFVLPIVVLGLVAAGFRFALRLHVPPPDQAAAWQQGLAEWQQTTVNAIGDFHPVLLDAAPLIAALTALTVAVYLWRRYPQRAIAAPFLAAYGLWTLVPSVSLVLMRFGAPIWDRPAEAGLEPALFGNVHPMTLDLGITVLVLGFGLLALRRGGLVAPPLLLALLGASTVIAYGDQFTPPAWAIFLFWIGLAFPIAVQYGLDAAALNKPGPDRSARILFAVATTLLAIAASYAALTIGAVAPGDVTTAAMVRQLAVMPLVLTFVLAYASQWSAEHAEGGSQAEAAA